MSVQKDHLVKLIIIAITNLGIRHRLLSGVPVLLVCDEHGPPLEDVLRSLADVMQLPAVNVPLPPMSDAKMYPESKQARHTVAATGNLEQHMASGQAKLVQICVDVTTIEQNAEAVKHTFSLCAPLSIPPSSSAVMLAAV